MRMFLYILAVVLIVVLYFGIPFFHSVLIGKSLTMRAVPYQKLSEDTSVSLLVVGDSTGVGVGATKPDESVAGLFANYLHATYVENHAVSGALVADLPSQIGKAKLKNYSVILIQIGANDIIQFHDATPTAAELGKLLATLPKSDRVFLMSAGNVGAAIIFPFFFRSTYTRLTLAYHTAFQNLADANHITYVNLYTPPAADPFIAHPEIYFAGDGFHPSSEGYKLWYEKLILKQ